MLYCGSLFLGVDMRALLFFVICAALLAAAQNDNLYHRTATCPDGSKTSIWQSASTISGPWTFGNPDDAAKLEVQCADHQPPPPAPARPEAAPRHIRRTVKAPPVTVYASTADPTPTATAGADEAFQRLNSSPDTNPMAGEVILCLLLLPIYFVPAITANVRRCKAKAGIVIINLFLGWTFVGWVGALAWAAVGETEPYEFAAEP